MRECIWEVMEARLAMHFSCMYARGNVVMLGPDALNSENAESTLEILDRMAGMAGGSRACNEPAPAVASPQYPADFSVSKLCTSSGQQEIEHLFYA